MKVITDEQRLACRVTAQARDAGARLIVEGARLLDVAEEVEKRMRDLGAEPAFPVNLSIGKIAAHYTPRTEDPLVFSSGDLVKLDVGAHVDGHIGDTAITVEVGTNRWTGLIQAAEEALDRAIDICKPGVSTRDMGSVIERSICFRGFQPIKNLTGHGLGRYNLHSDPSIPNIPEGPPFLLKEGMVVAVEPFSTTGDGYVKGAGGGNIYHMIRDRRPKDAMLSDVYNNIKENYALLPFAERWLDSSPKEMRKLCRQGSISEYDILVEATGGMVAQKEHTLLVTEDCCEVLTRS